MYAPRGGRKHSNLVHGTARPLNVTEVPAGSRWWLVFVSAPSRCDACNGWLLPGDELADPDRAVVQPATRSVLCTRCAELRRLDVAPALRGRIQSGLTVMPDR